MSTVAKKKNAEYLISATQAPPDVPGLIKRNWRSEAAIQRRTAQSAQAVPKTVIVDSI
jgi:hypothetical protein